MDRVYLVMQGRLGEGSYNRAVFSTLEKAEKYKNECQKLNDDTLTVFRVDPWIVDFMSEEELDDPHQ